MLSKYGLKIKNFSCGILYEYNLGLREHLTYTNAMFTNNLLSYYLVEHGLKVSKDGRTRDIIGINFDLGAKSYAETRKKIEHSIELQKSSCDDPENDERLDNLNTLLEFVESHADDYVKKSKEEIREEFYTNGVDITYTTYKKDGSVKKKETIHYKMLYRSTGKAKLGSCMFISDRLYKTAHDFIYMGIRIPKHNAPIVEASAYVSLVASSVVDRICIDPKNILILNDVQSSFNTNVISIETDEHKRCYAKQINDYVVKNELFDGQALIDSSIFPSWGNGYILLRHHMCKTAAFKANVQQFFKDYFGDDYDDAIVVDMFGNEHYARDIQMITTNNAMKWLKFDVSYEYWCERVGMNGNMFGIVKTAHKSKLGEVQKMSYQMINSLDIDIMQSVTQVSKDYIMSLKSDDDVFLQYLKDNVNFSNDFDVLVALCEQNPDFVRCDYFRERRKKIIRNYIKKFKTGKVIQGGDNLVMVGSPYAMLLHSVREDVEKDKTLLPQSGAIQCYTKRFAPNTKLAGFRSPHNGKNNILSLYNVDNELLDKYFDIGEQCIAVNCIHTDLQDRANGCDFDSDSIYCTDQQNIADFAQQCYYTYPTIVNNIPKEQNHYTRTLSDYAKIDNQLANSQLAIGESSNLAQLALTYTYNFPDKKYKDYVCILSVLAQVSIDSAKRRYDIDISDEIKRIKKDMNIKEHGYPVFWTHIRKDFSEDKINDKLVCPMNVLSEIKFRNAPMKKGVLPINYFLKSYTLKESRRTSRKVEKLIEKYSLELFNAYVSDEDEYFILRNDFDELIEDIRKIYISKEYLGLMSWLVTRAFMLTPQSYQSFSKTHKNKAILLKTLYSVNPKCLLEVFSKNAP